MPVLFLAIAILTMVTTMHRIAANEKVQIGTLKALGFRDNKILLHYTSYGLMIGVIGMAAVAAAYPLYNSVLKKEQARIAPEILRLADDLMK